MVLSDNSPLECVFQIENNCLSVSAPLPFGTGNEVEERSDDARGGQHLFRERGQKGAH